jgi:hypothetical protein
MDMWLLEENAEYKKRIEHWPAKHRRELESALDNFDTLFRALNAGAKLEQIKYGFIHREPKGIIAIDQKGGGAGLKETRLYAYPEKEPQIVHIITIGDKKTQKADIKYSIEYVDSLAVPENN